MTEPTTTSKETITATWTPLSDFLKRNPDYRARRALDGIALAKVQK